MNWPSPGIHFDIAPRDYFRQANDEPRVLSKSLLWDFAKNPKRWLEAPYKESTPVMIFGSMVDCMLLTPSRFDFDFVVSPFDSFRTKEAKEWKDNQRGNIVTNDNINEAKKAVGKLKNHHHVKEMMEGDAKTQVSVMSEFAGSSDTIRVKGLIDLVPDVELDWGNHLIDLKTIGKMDSLRQIENQIYDFGYHMQAAIYLDLFNAHSGLEPRDSFTFIFSLSAPPYEVAIVELETEAIEAGRTKYIEAIQLWNKCATSGNYPSPFDGILTTGLPKWAV